MKFTMPLLALGAGLATASPLRIVFIANQPNTQPVNIRIGHPGAGVMHMEVAGLQSQGTTPSTRRPCHGKQGGFQAMRNKAMELSNTLRHAIGLPPIEQHSSEITTSVVQPDPVFAYGVTKFHHGGYIARPHPTHAHRKQASFWTRLSHSLMSLGPWEGRAVAFVFGCGLGVLLRMFFVLAIVSYRAIKGKGRDEDQESPIAYIALAEEDAENILVAPPQYTHEKDNQVFIGSAEKN